MTEVTRRTAILGATTVLYGAGVAESAVTSQAVAAHSPSDEARWAKIAALYPVTREIVQLENAYWGSMAEPVAAAHREQVARLNRDNSWYARRAMIADQARAKERAAEAMGVLPEEVGWCRNAAEGLTALIMQYRDVGAGDQILFADTDYETTQGAMRSLAAARGAQAIKINLPAQMTRANLIEAYREAFARAPRLKLVLLTHMSHRNGLVLPVSEIVPLVKAHGAQAIVDCAQSFYQIPFRIPDFGADFVGLNFHKWVGAPLGVAAIWVRKGMASAIAPAPELPDAGPEDVQAKVHQGTVDFAPQLTVPAALDFQATIDRGAKIGRLQFLRNRWVSQVRSIPGVEVLLPDDPSLYGATTSFRLHGQTTPAANIALTDVLLNRFGIMTVHRIGLSGGTCIRATPSLFTSTVDVDKLAAAIQTLAAATATK
ncbi:MAG: aminotransferase class V-fold PLP-dependent enzyme [Beijerinckiaceae bacterium]|jgi:selenocysteine lyase/cysteine desulfurase|nr:aminotransferase class V-fold PLP-dependent enzyme [Beijerinckiaceae bacterium]